MRNRLLSRGPLCIALLLAAAIPAAPAGVGQSSSLLDRCRSDLAQRVKAPTSEVQVVRSTPVTWPDSSLGLPRPGEMYLQVITPGARLILRARDTSYLYTTGRSAFRYGGPLAMWSASALYLKREAGNPNLNGSLTQVSLMGTHPTALMADVADYYPQANGGILATRRTSRSGFDLLYLAPGPAAQPETVGSAFSFGPVALGPSGKEWIGFVRAGTGSPWALARGRLGQRQFQVTSLPAGSVPGQVMLLGGRFILEALKDGGAAFYEWAPGAPGKAPRRVDFRRSPFGQPIMLGKSDELAMVSTQGGGQASTRLVRRSSRGGETVVATIPGFRGESLEAGPGHVVALMSGRQGDRYAAYSADVHVPGSAVPVVRDSDAPVKLLAAPPRGASRLLSGGSRAPAAR